MSIYLDPKKKFSITLDVLFCSNVSSYFPLDRLEFTFSKRTGKIKHVMLDGKILATLRSDGGFALTLEGAKILLRDERTKEICIVVKNNISQFIREGSSVFCKHVVNCGSNINVGSEVIILNEDNELLGVGKSILPSKLITLLKRGIAAKVRHAIPNKLKGSVEKN